MNIEDFGPFTLSACNHASPSEGMCVMEMVSFLAGEEWSDNPPCSSPVVAKFCQVINDRFDQTVRDRLQSYVPRLIGTASPQYDNERAKYLAWSAIRVFAPIALRAEGFDEWAERLENLDGNLSEARKVFSEARNAAFASASAAYAASDASASAASSADASAASAYAASASASAASSADAYAAYAAYASVSAAATSASAAAYAAASAADYAASVDAVFKVLDGLLEIGPSGQSYQPEHLARVEPLRKAMEAAQ